MNRGFEKFRGIRDLHTDRHNSRNCNISAESFAMARQGKKEIEKNHSIYFYIVLQRSKCYQFQVGEIFQI